MKNTIVKYDYEEVDDMLVPDYFSRNVNLFELKDQFQDMLEVYKIDDNDKLERISLELYGTTDYWDILLMINDRNPLLEFPYDFDNVYTNAQTFVDIYRYFIYSHAPLIVGDIAEKMNAEFLQNSIDKNESYRYIQVIKPTRMSDFIKLAKDNAYL